MIITFEIIEFEKKGRLYIFLNVKGVGGGYYFIKQISAWDGFHSTWFHPLLEKLLDLYPQNLKYACVQFALYILSLWLLGLHGDNWQARIACLT